MNNEYIIVHTYNGVGYSDSKAEVVEFDNPRKQFKEYVDTKICSGEKVLMSDDSFEARYNDDDDEAQGCITMVKWNGQTRVIMWPDVNTFLMFHDRTRYLKYLGSVNVLGNAEDSDELGELIANDEGGIHLKQGYMIIQKLES